MTCILNHLFILNNFILYIKSIEKTVQI